ncbi:Prephenate decarboxylase [Planktothrix tepida]|uniref:Prephenate dehydratase n=2 Tax=Planktothrix TaxID=54304 RepID=A0A1J1LR89_9CYAN|nr:MULTISPECIES: bacilysin biosynthesis protein BacA [Planktothrix]CAD5944265.1 Prephenate decarboxylase [Planktothrix pseudagardhii]CAD5966547.1 Prephenate decarboxylase [Planktothrix tepida]CUR35077.1 conserved hypothetical protein [Planktothrix tepida PCC 9214]
MLKFSIEFTYPIPISNTLTIGTLGPSGTSSENALNYLINQLQAQAINLSSQLFDNFILVKEALLQEQVDLALVPHAYDKVNEFYMEPNFNLGFIFIYPTPIYGLAKKKNTELDLKNCSIVTHPAPIPLLPKLLPDTNIKDIQMTLASSTSAAAMQVNQGLADLAITNENAVKEYDLEFISTFGEIPMSWSIFYKKQRGQYV